MREWSGKKYWLVGASEGLGRAVAEQLSAVGTELILSARNEERLVELADALPGKARAVPVDIASDESVAEAAEKVGEIDGFVFLAGVYWPMSARDWKVDEEEKDRPDSELLIEIERYCLFSVIYQSKELCLT